MTPVIRSKKGLGLWWLFKIQFSKNKYANNQSHLFTCYFICIEIYSLTKKIPNFWREHCFFSDYSSSSRRSNIQNCIYYNVPYSKCDNVGWYKKVLDISLKVTYPPKNKRTEKLDRKPVNNFYHNFYFEAILRKIQIL